MVLRFQSPGVYSRWFVTQIPCLLFSFFLFFFFFLSFVQCFSRYKKLSAELAMERTKPINQNKQQKKPFSGIPPGGLKLPRLKPLPCRPSRPLKYKETTRQKLLVIYAFFAMKDISKENQNTQSSSRNEKRKTI